MNIDERLDRLVERHEALAQTVELMIHSHREDYQKLLEGHTRHQEAMEKNQVMVTQILETANRLVDVAHAHERRISNLETARN